MRLSSVRREKNPRQIKRPRPPLETFYYDVPGAARPLRTRLCRRFARNKRSWNGKTFGFRREKTRPETKDGRGCGEMKGDGEREEKHYRKTDAAAAAAAAAYLLCRKRNLPVPKVENRVNIYVGRHFRQRFFIVIACFRRPVKYYRRVIGRPRHLRPSGSAGGKVSSRTKQHAPSIRNRPFPRALRPARGTRRRWSTNVLAHRHTS